MPIDTALIEDLTLYCSTLVNQSSDIDIFKLRSIVGLLSENEPHAALRNAYKNMLEQNARVANALILDPQCFLELSRHRHTGLNTNYASRKERLFFTLEKATAFEDTAAVRQMANSLQRFEKDGEPTKEQQHILHNISRGSLQVDSKNSAQFPKATKFLTSLATEYKALSNNASVTASKNITSAAHSSTILSDIDLFLQKINSSEINTPQACFNLVTQYPFETHEALWQELLQEYSEVTQDKLTRALEFEKSDDFKQHFIQFLKIHPSYATWLNCLSGFSEKKQILVAWANPEICKTDDFFDFFSALKEHEKGSLLSDEAFKNALSPERYLEMLAHLPESFAKEELVEKLFNNPAFARHLPDLLESLPLKKLWQELEICLSKNHTQKLATVLFSILQKPEGLKTLTSTIQNTRLLQETAKTLLMHYDVSKISIPTLNELFRSASLESGGLFQTLLNAWNTTPTTNPMDKIRLAVVMHQHLQERLTLDPQDTIQDDIKDTWNHCITALHAALLTDPPMPIAPDLYAPIAQMLGPRIRSFYSRFEQFTKENQNAIQNKSDEEFQQFISSPEHQYLQEEMTALHKEMHHTFKPLAPIYGHLLEQAAIEPDTSEYKSYWENVTQLLSLALLIYDPFQEKSDTSQIEALIYNLSALLGNNGLSQPHEKWPVLHNILEKLEAQYPESKIGLDGLWQGLCDAHTSALSAISPQSAYWFLTHTAPSITHAEIAIMAIFASSYITSLAKNSATLPLNDTLIHELTQNLAIREAMCEALWKAMKTSPNAHALPEALRPLALLALASQDPIDAFPLLKQNFGFEVALNANTAFAWEAQMTALIQSLDSEDSDLALALFQQFFTHYTSKNHYQDSDIARHMLAKIVNQASIYFQISVKDLLKSCDPDLKFSLFEDAISGLNATRNIFIQPNINAKNIDAQRAVWFDNIPIPENSHDLMYSGQDNLHIVYLEDTYQWAIVGRCEDKSNNNHAVIEFAATLTNPIALSLWDTKSQRYLPNTQAQEMLGESLYKHFNTLQKRIALDPAFAHGTQESRKAFSLKIQEYLQEQPSSVKHYQQQSANISRSLTREAAENPKTTFSQKITHHVLTHNAVGQVYGSLAANVIHTVRARTPELSAISVDDTGRANSPLDQLRIEVAVLQHCLSDVNVIAKLQEKELSELINAFKARIPYLLQFNKESQKALIKQYQDNLNELPHIPEAKAELEILADAQNALSTKSASSLPTAHLESSDTPMANATRVDTLNASIAKAERLIKHIDLFSSDAYLVLVINRLKENIQTAESENNSEAAEKANQVLAHYLSHQFQSYHGANLLQRLSRGAENILRALAGSELEQCESILSGLLPKSSFNPALTQSQQNLLAQGTPLYRLDEQGQSELFGYINSPARPQDNQRIYTLDFSAKKMAFQAGNVLYDADNNVYSLNENGELVQDLLYGKETWHYILLEHSLEELKAYGATLNLPLLDIIQNGMLNAFFDGFLSEKTDNLDKKAFLRTQIFHVIHTATPTLSQEDGITLAKQYPTSNLLSVLEKYTNTNDPQGTSRQALLEAIMLSDKHRMHFLETPDSQTKLWNTLSSLGNNSAHFSATALLALLQKTPKHLSLSGVLRQQIRAAYLQQADLSSPEAKKEIQHFYFKDISPALLGAQLPEVLKQSLQVPQNFDIWRQSAYLNVLHQKLTPKDWMQAFKDFLRNTEPKGSQYAQKGMLAFYTALGEKNFWKAFNEHYPASGQALKRADWISHGIFGNPWIMQALSEDLGTNSLMKLIQHDAHQLVTHVGTSMGLIRPIPDRYQSFSINDMVGLIEHYTQHPSESLGLFLADWLLIQLQKNQWAVDEAPNSAQSDWDYLASITWDEEDNIELTASQPILKTSQNSPQTNLTRLTHAQLDIIKKLVGNSAFKGTFTTKYPFLESKFETLLDESIKRDPSNFKTFYNDPSPSLSRKKFVPEAANLKISLSLNGAWNNNAWVSVKAIDYALMESARALEANKKPWNAWKELLNDYVGSLHYLENKKASPLTMQQELSEVRKTLLRLLAKGEQTQNHAMDVFLTKENFILLQKLYETVPTNRIIWAEVEKIIGALFVADTEKFLTQLAQFDWQPQWKFVFDKIMPNLKNILEKKTDEEFNALLNKQQDGRSTVMKDVLAGALAGGAAGYFLLNAPVTGAALGAAGGALVAGTQMLANTAHDTFAKTAHHTSNFVDSARTGLALKTLQTARAMYQDHAFEVKEQAGKKGGIKQGFRHGWRRVDKYDAKPGAWFPWIRGLRKAIGIQFFGASEPKSQHNMPSYREETPVIYINSTQNSFSGNAIVLTQTSTTENTTQYQCQFYKNGQKQGDAFSLGGNNLTGNLHHLTTLAAGKSRISVLDFKPGSITTLKLRDIIQGLEVSRNNAIHKTAVLLSEHHYGTRTLIQPEEKKEVTHQAIKASLKEDNITHLQTHLSLLKTTSDSQTDLLNAKIKTSALVSILEVINLTKTKGQAHISDQAIYTIPSNWISKIWINATSSFSGKYTLENQDIHKLRNMLITFAKEELNDDASYQAIYAIFSGNSPQFNQHSHDNSEKIASLSQAAQAQFPRVDELFKQLEIDIVKQKPLAKTLDTLHSHLQGLLMMASKIQSLTSPQDKYAISTINAIAQRFRELNHLANHEKCSESHKVSIQNMQNNILFEAALIPERLTLKRLEHLHDAYEKAQPHNEKQHIFEAEKSTIQKDIEHCENMIQSQHHELKQAAQMHSTSPENSGKKGAGFRPSVKIDFEDVSEQITVKV